MLRGAPTLNPGFGETAPVRTDLFDFELPEERIALYPADPRDSARMLVVDPRSGRLRDCGVLDLPDLLQPGDALVFNDTRVIPAALDGVRVRDGVEAKVAFNLIKRVDGARWRAFARPARRECRRTKRCW